MDQFQLYRDNVDADEGGIYYVYKRALSVSMKEILLARLTLMTSQTVRSNTLSLKQS
jgi:predicted transcriptional regulator